MSDPATSRRRRLADLEARSAPLATSPDARTARLAQAGEYVEQFLARLPTQPVYSPAGDRDAAMQAMQLSSEPASLPTVLDVLSRHVDSAGHNIAAAGFLAYVPSGGLYEAALGDYLAAATNRYAGVAYASPGSARMEETLLRWLADTVGYPPEASGDLTSGGSIAALSAIIAARESRDVRSAVDQCVVYRTTQMHHTFGKALHVAGLAGCPVREIEMDDGLRMIPAALEAAVARDREKGLRPWLVAASAGSTDVGAVDPLEAVADIASAYDLWMHVDAAYGGAFMLCEEGRRRLRGIERSDSLVLDPHKGFFLPCGLGAVLVRRGQDLYDAYHARGTYMQDMTHDTERSPCDYSPELTRPFRALRLWLPLKVFGTAPFAAALEEKLLLAEYFHEQIGNVRDIVPGPNPDLSIVTFRCRPRNEDSNAFNKRLVEAIRDDGRILLTSTTIGGRFTLRLAVLGHNTHLDAIDTAIEVIREKTHELLQQLA